MLNLPHPPGWVDRALCAEIGGDLWHPQDGERGTEARLICARCPVSAQCLAFALEHHDEHGIYGGTTYKERRAIRKAAA